MCFRPPQPLSKPLSRRSGPTIRSSGRASPSRGCPDATSGTSSPCCRTSAGGGLGPWHRLRAGCALAWSVRVSDSGDTPTTCRLRAPGSSACSMNDWVGGIYLPSPSGLAYWRRLEFKSNKQNQFGVDGRGIATLCKGLWVTFMTHHIPADEQHPDASAKACATATSGSLETHAQSLSQA